MLKVIHLDDNLAELKAVEKLLTAPEAPCRFQVESFSEVEKFRERLMSGSSSIDIALIDIHLKGQNTNGVSVAA